MIDFRFNYPVLDFQHQLLIDSLAQLEPNHIYLKMETPGGDPDDRIVAAKWLSKPDYQIDPGSVFIACGGHHAVTVIILAAKLAGSAVLVDPLTYNGFIGQASMFNITLIPCPIDEDGMLPDAMSELCVKHDIKAVYLMPTIHNPPCFIMPLTRRKEIVEVARHLDLLLIDDDAYGFLAPEAPVSFAHLAPERAFFIYSFAKALAPGVKTSYMIIPPKWQNQAVSTIRLTSSGSVSLLSRLVANWIQAGIVTEIIEEKRRIASGRQKIVKRVLGEFNYVTQPTSFHFWLPIPEFLNAQEFGENLLAKGVDIVTSQEYQVEENSRNNGIRVALGNVSDENILVNGLTIIAETLNQA